MFAETQRSKENREIDKERKRNSRKPATGELRRSDGVRGDNDIRVRKGKGEGVNAQTEKFENKKSKENNK